MVDQDDDSSSTPGPLEATAFGLAFGGVYGVITHAWRDAPTGRQNAWASLGQSTRGIAMNSLKFGLLAGSYSVAHSTFAALRGTDDAWNAVGGGFVAASLLTFPTRRLPTVIAFSTALGLTMGAAHTLSQSKFFRPKPEVSRGPQDRPKRVLQ